MSNLSTFASRQMLKLGPQEPLPNGIFRNFLLELEAQMGADGNSEEIDSLLQRFESLDGRTSEAEGNIFRNKSSIEILFSLLERATTRIQQLDAKFHVEDDTLYVNDGGKLYSVALTEVSNNNYPYIVISAYPYYKYVKTGNTVAGGGEEWETESVPADDTFRKLYITNPSVGDRAMWYDNNSWNQSGLSRITKVVNSSIEDDGSMPTLDGFSIRQTVNLGDAYKSVSGRLSASDAEIDGTNYYAFGETGNIAYVKSATPKADDDVYRYTELVDGGFGKVGTVGFMTYHGSER